MKTRNLILAVILLCTATTFARVDINEANFPCENFRNWVLWLWETKGYITDAEIENTTSLSAVGMNISDLTGIQFFTNLTFLDVSRNQLTSLDVSSLTNLESLRVSINRLTSLDISGLTNIRVLVAGGNQLTSLDVSRLTNLETLSVASNQLTSFDDVSGLTNNIRWLDISVNQLTSLDVSRLTNLETLSVASNQLTSLDVSRLTNLEWLNVGSNQLTSLDVSRLTNLESLHVYRTQLTSLDVSRLTNLKTLYVYSNQLTSLDVSRLTNLKTLYVYSNQLTSLDVSGLTNLEWLFCFDNQLTSIDLTGLDSLVDFIGNNQTLALTLTGANDNYSLEIELNNPTELVFGLDYFNGILTSTSNEITSSPFTVETGNPNFTLSGTLTLRYETETSIREIKNENRQPIAFYTITGARLHTEPQSGIYIILYDDGTSEKVLR